MTVALIGLVTFAVAAFLTRRLCDPNSWLWVLDHPNERSLHSRPTPRTGGVAMVVAILLASAWAVWAHGRMPAELGWLAVAVLLVAITAFLDDRAHLSAAARIVVHFIAAGMVVHGGLELDSGLLWMSEATFGGIAALVITVLFLVWMLNLYNFMDGMDGFAGGMAVFGFGAYAVLGALVHQPLFAALNLIVAAAAGGFLLFNFPPARIFMGDTGSSTLGLLAGGFSIWGAQQAVFPFWVGLLVFSPFIVDATITLLRRLIRREKVWRAHKTHYYQRLVQLGWGHRKTVLCEYGLMTACAVSAIVAVNASSSVQRMILAVWVAVYVLIPFAVGRLERATHAGQT